MEELAELRQRIKELEKLEVAHQRTEVALRESEEKFRDLAEQSPNMIFINKKGRIVYANKRCEEIMGYSREEFYSPDFNYLRLIAPEYVDLVRSNFAKHMRGEDIPPYEYAIISKDGRRVEAILAPKVVQYEGEIAILGTVTDITEQKKAEDALKESEEKYRLLFTTASEGIVTLDLKGTIVDVNSTFLRMIGFDRDTIVGKNIATLARLFKISSKQVLSKFKDFLSGKTVETEWSITTKEGTRIDLKVFPSIIKKDRKSVGISAIVTDITERKQAENLTRIQRDLGLAIAAATDLDTVLRLCIEAAIQSSNMDCGGVYLVDQTTGGLVLMNHTGLSSEFIRVVSEYDPDAPSTKLVMAGEPVYSRHTELGVELDDPQRREGLQAIAVIPVKHEGKVIACLNTASHTLSEIPHISQNALETIASQIGGAIASKLAEEKLQRSESRYRELFEQNMAAVYRTTLDGQILDCNMALVRLLGYTSREEIMKGTALDWYFNLHDREAHIKYLFEKEKLINYERRLKRKDGSPIWILENIHIIHEANGTQIFQGTFIDITERRHAEDDLLLAKKELESTFEAISDWISMIDLEGRILRTNHIGEKLLGVPAKDIVGQTCWKLVHGTDEPIPECPFPRMLVSHKRESAEIKLPESDRWIMISVDPIMDTKGNLIGGVHVARDITERRRAEEMQRQSEQFMSSVLESIQDGISVLDPDLTVRHVNTVMEKWYEQNLPLEGRTCYECYHNNDKPCDPCPTLRCIETGKTEREIVPGLEGSPVEWIELFSYPMKNPKTGEVIGIVEFVRDITERKRAEKALQESEEKYRNLINQSHDAIYLLYDGKFEIINKRFEELFGYTQEETNTPDFNFINVVAPKSRGIIQERVQRVERGEFVSPQYEFTAISREGKEIEVETSVSYVKYKGSIATQGILRDITERKQLQEQLLQSEKMSALGQLISGVAHELNNPMTGVLGFSQLLLMSENIPDKEKQSLEKINQEAERARKIVQNLLTFARQRKPTKRTAQINEIANRTLDLRAYEMKVSNIEIVRTLDPNIPPVFADDHQIQQVFMNLIINAEQAMLASHQKGRLEVFTQCNIERSVISISFRDDGPGIAEEHLSKIFDPFFTTKPVGKGTGLGLSIAYGIIEEHGGRITAHNNREGGATFTVELPMHEVTIAESISPPQEAGVVTGVQKKLVLVVDDEASVVDLVRAALEREGHAVETAYDGNSALEKIEKSDFDAIVSDLKMPGKGGIDVYLYCKEKKPELEKRFLFLTGDVVASDSLRFMEEHKVPHVPKPFDLKNLISTITGLLQEE